jgi:hypothetical protein
LARIRNGLFSQAQSWRRGHPIAYVDAELIDKSDEREWSSAYNRPSSPNHVRHHRRPIRARIQSSISWFNRFCCWDAIEWISIYWRKTPSAISN